MKLLDWIIRLFRKKKPTYAIPIETKKEVIDKIVGLQNRKSPLTKQIIKVNNNRKRTPGRKFIYINGKKIFVQ